MENKFKIHTDGGARGNPGPAAVGIVIEGDDLKKEYSEYIGKATNNEAEYRAVIFSLKKLKQLVGKERAKKEIEVEVYLDSELLAKQLNGRYKIKEKDLQQLFLEVWNLKQDFKQVDFIFVPREQNRRADQLVNQALNREASRLDL